MLERFPFHVRIANRFGLSDCIIVGLDGQTGNSLRGHELVNFGDLQIRQLGFLARIAADHQPLLPSSLVDGGQEVLRSLEVCETVRNG